MEPAFHRGDLLFLTNYEKDQVNIGDIVVFKIEGRDIPIVHRVIKFHQKEDGKMKILTKGDNNSVNDRGLYAPGQFWLDRKVRFSYSCSNSPSNQDSNPRRSSISEYEPRGGRNHSNSDLSLDLTLNVIIYDFEIFYRLQDIVGRARGFVPYVGWLTICMNDFPKLKYFVLGTLGLFVVLRRE